MSTVFKVKMVQCILANHSYEIYEKNECVSLLRVWQHFVWVIIFV